MNLYVDDRIADSTFTNELSQTTTTQSPSVLIQDNLRSAAFELHKPVVFMNADNARGFKFIKGLFGKTGFKFRISIKF